MERFIYFSTSFLKVNFLSQRWQNGKLEIEKNISKAQYNTLKMVEHKKEKRCFVRMPVRDFSAYEYLVMTRDFTSL